MAKYLVQIAIVFTLLFTVVFSPKVILGQNSKFSSIVLPIRGQEFWNYPKITPLDQVQYLKQSVNNHNLAATWLIRYDALQTDIRQALLNSESPTEVGAFLEITPSLAYDSHVEYPGGGNWYYPNKVFLSGYSVEDRYKLVDTYMGKFLSIYGEYPATVGAWHIDSESAKYLSRRYGITGIVICSDQYSTDRYQLWGSWWSVPYIPSQVNLQIPASTPDYKLPVVIGQWAARDPIHGYGPDTTSSRHSVQANDYLLLGYGSDYFKRLASIYLDNPKNQFGFLLIGIENDYDFSYFGQEFDNQLTYLASRQDVNTVTFQDFSKWYLNTYNLSPEHFIESTDQDSTITWKMNTKNRTAALVTNNISQTIDLRNYDQTYPEAFILNRNPHNTLSTVIPAQIDSVSSVETSPFNLKPWINQWPSFSNRIISLVIITLIFLILTRKTLTISFLIAIGSWIWMVPMIRSGTLMNYGLGFWGANGHDAVWHLSIIEHFNRHFNFDNPLFSHSSLINYHYGSDLIQSFIHRITRINNLDLYFAYIPMALSLLIGLALVNLLKTLNQSRFTKITAILMLYLGGSAGWLVTLFQTRSLGGETLFWAQQSISTMINPPFAWSLLIILLALSLLVHYWKTPSPKLLILVSLLIGLMTITKIYAGVLFLFGLGYISVTEIPSLISLAKIFTKHKSSHFDLNYLLTSIPTIPLTFLSAVISLFLLLPVLDFSSGSQFIWSPGWFLSSLVQNPDHFYSPKLATALQAYQATGQYLKYYLAMSLIAVIFFIGNFWGRILGFIPSFTSVIKTNKPHVNRVYLLINVVMITATVIPFLFIQKGTAWNTIQFLYYALFHASIFTSLFLGKIFTKTFQQSLVILIIIVLNLPTTLGVLNQYLPDRAPARMPTEELHALQFLSAQPEGTVLTYPFISNEKRFYDVPLALRVYESTAYVSALSSQPVVMEDQVNLEITSLPWNQRRTEIINFFLNSDVISSQEFIKNYQVKYLYLYKDQPLPVQLGYLQHQKIYDTGLVTIYQFN